MPIVRFLSRYDVQVLWRFLQITGTIITITKALLASFEPMIFLINGVRTVGKPQLLTQLMAGVDRGQMAGFNGGVHSVELNVDEDEL
jgi:hypothetical protein